MFRYLKVLKVYQKKDKLIKSINIKTKNKKKWININE